MTALEIKKELSDSIENGTIVTTIYDTYVKHLNEDINQLSTSL